MLAIVTRTHTQAKGFQLRLLASCAMATSMISAGAVQAATPVPPPLTGADAAFQGIGTVVSGIATIVQTPTMDTITVATPQTVINFTPFDTANGGGPITFLPSGRTGLFQNDPNSGLTNFTVLNRVIPTDATRAIRFDGTVQSRIVDAIGGSTPGGTILFYSPGGIIASSSAVFDVGSLVLSAADVGFGASSNSFSFSGAAAGTTVDINNGASIIAQGVGSYVALVAPRVVQSGSVRSDGSIGYIAAGAVDVTIQNNLFDISFVQGTDSGAAITHTGTTELTRAPNDTSPQRIYVAAVPKNDAITTLISGSLGYSAATSASVRNGAIILSAGRNVSDSGYGANFTDFAAGTAPANITIGADGGTIFNASVLTNATGDALIAPAAGTTIQFNNNVALNADRLAEVRAVATSSALFNAGLSVSSNNLVDGAAARVIALGETGYGGSSGLISVIGNLVVDGGPSQGVGEVRTPVSLLAADLGRVTVSGSATVKASDADAVFARNAFGGSATVRVGAAGSQLSAAGLVIEAGARGVAGLDENEMPLAGNATGGMANVILGGGTFAPINISFDSSAVSDLGGVAIGGTASLVASGGVVGLGTILANVSASALQSGDTGTGPEKERGAAFFTNEATPPSSTGGTIQFDVTDTVININGDLLLNASASGSEGIGALQGGTIAINANNGSLLVGDLISANVSAEESASALGVQPGAVRGGTITALVSNNGDILASAMNYGANAVSGGDTVGGSVSLTTNSGGRIRSTGTIGIDASAMTRGLESAGDAIGGNIIVNINSGSLQSGPLILDANALGGEAIFGGIGGSAVGGSASVNISGGDSIIESFNLTTDAAGGRGGLGNGGAEAGGAGGAATAGTSEINITNGVVRTAGLVISSSAIGGDGGEGTLGGAGGVATGGRAAVLTSEAATLFLMKLATNPLPTPLASSVDSSARGGSGGLGHLTSGGAGGAATGGTSILTLAGADIQPNTPRFAVDLTVNSEAAGGLGGASNNASGGSGGSAIGGTAMLNLVNNHIDFGNVALSTRGSGGSGGNASNSGYGALGTGGAGGNGSAGMASVTASTPLTNIVSTNIANLSVVAEAVGGSGGNGAVGGNGGNALNGGLASFTHTAGAITSSIAILTSNSFGGRGGDGFDGNGGNGGNSLGGTARITVDGATANLTINVAGVAAVAQNGAGGNAQSSGSIADGGNAGTATGGTAEILAKNGAALSLALTATTNARGIGASGGNSSNGNGGAGGAGAGGTARIDGSGGALTALDLTAGAGGFGGSGGDAGNLGNGGTGGLATGGLSTITNARLNAQNSTVFIGADAVGGNGGAGQIGGNGGAAVGGNSSFSAKNITNLIGTIEVTASTGGGMGGGQTGAGGNAQSGTAELAVSGGALQVSSVMVKSVAEGGRSNLTENGGPAAGGTARLIASNGATLNIGNVLLNANALANSFEALSGNQPIRNTATSATGDHATGGTAELSVSSGAALVANTATMSANAMILGSGGGGDETGPTGSAANGGMPDGTATGGTVSVNVNNATVLLTQTLELAANGEAQIGTAQGGTVNVFATGGTLTTPSAIVTANGSSLVTGTEIGGRGGIIDIRAERAANGTAGVLNLGSADLEASGFSTLIDNPEAATNAAAGRINIAANGGQTTATNFSTLSARTLGRNTSGFNPNNGIFLNADQGGILANSTVMLLSDESIAVSAMGTGNLFVGDSLNAEALNTITVNHTGRSANANTILAANASLTAGNDFNAMPGSRIRADNDLTITSTFGGVSAGELVAGDDIAVSANGLVNITGIALTTGAAAMGGESDISIVTPGDVSVNMVDAFGNFRVNSASLLASGSIIAGEDVDLLTTGAITTQAISAGDDVLATSNSGNITILSATARGTGPDDGMGDADVVIRSTSGAITLGAAMSNDEIVLSTAGNITANNLTTTGVGLGLDAAANRSNIIIDSGAVVLIDTINSQTSLAVRGASITASNLTAGEDIALSASGDISVTTALAADDFSATSSGGNITLTGITTNANGADDRTVNFGYGEISFGMTAANGSDIDATAGYGTINLGTLNAANDLIVTAQTIAALAPATLVAGQDISLTAQTSLTVGDATAGRDFSLTSNGSASVVNVTAGDDIIINALGAVSATGSLLTTGLGSLGSDSDIEITTPAAFTFNAVSAFSNFRFNSGSLSGNSILAGNSIVITADSASSNAATTTTGNILINARAVSLGITNAGLDLIIDTQGAASSSIMIGTASAARDILLTGGTNDITATGLTAGDDIDVTGSGSVSITSALTDGSFNSGYGGDASNLSVTSSSSTVSVATGRAKDNLTLTAATGVISTTSLTADRGAILVNGGTSATLMNTIATLGAVTLNADAVNATNVNAATDIGVNFGASALLGTLVAGNDVILNGTGNATIGNASATRDITAMISGDVAITSASAGRNLRNTSASLSATTLGAGTDVIVITDAAANLGTTTAGARIVVNAGTDISFTQLMSGTTTSLVAGTSITGGNANAGTALTLNANGGAVAFGMLSSGTSTSITASSAITGNSANAGGALTLNSGANGITATTLTSGSGNNLTVTASNGGNAAITTATSGLDLSVNAMAVSVVTGTAARDVLYTAASNIVAGATSAGRNVALNAVGTINATTTTAAANIVANSTGSASLVTATADNIFAVSTGDVTLGTANVATMLGVNAQNISGTSLAAGEDIRLIASSTANVSSATAGDDFDVSATNGITLGDITTSGTARDDRSLAFNAPAFAIVATPADGSDIRLTSNGAVNAANLNAGDDIRVDSGNFTLTGLARTRGLGITDTGSDVVINGDAVTVAMVNAASNLSVNSESFVGTSLIAGGAISVITSEDQSLGTADAAQGPITGNSTRGTISFVDLSTGGDISLNAGAAITGGSADAGGSIQFTASNGVNFDNLTSGGSTNISGGASVSGDNISADGDIFVGSDIINLGSLTSNFASIFLGGRDVTVGTAGTRFDFTVDTSEPTNSRIALGDVIVGRDILLTGATNGLTATSLMAGDDIDIDITGNAKIGLAITDGSFNGGYGDDTRPAPIGNEGYGGDLSNITLNSAQAMIGTAQARDNVTLTTITGTMAGTVIADQGDILINGGTSANIMRSEATLGSITINADTVTANSASAADAFSVNFGGNASLGTVNAGSIIAVTGTGNADFASLTSGGDTVIMAGGSVTGGVSTAGGLLSVMADSIDVDTLISTGSDVVASARIIDIGTTTAARDALIDTKGLASSSITLGTVDASRDIALTGGTNGITATGLTAGDDIDVVGSGKVTITNALTNGSFNSGYGEVADPSNLNLTANSGTITLGTGRAKDNITLTTTGGATAAMLTADQGAILVNGGATANIAQSTATLGSITIHADTVTAGSATSADGFSVNFVRNASLGTVNAGGVISVSGTGDATFTSLTSGGATSIMAGDTLIGGTSTAGGLLSVMADSIDLDSLTSTASSVVASARTADIGTTSAAVDALINTKGLANSSITLGTVTAGRDISLTGGTNGIVATSLTAGDDIDVVGSGSAVITSALTTGSSNTGYGDSGYGGDPSNITLSATQAMIGTARAKDNVSLTTINGTTATALIADRGAITVRGGTLAMIDSATTTLANVDIMANRVTTGTVNAGTDVAIAYVSDASLGAVTAGTSIDISGTGSASFTSLASGTITRANVGAALSGGAINAGTSLSATAGGAFTATGPITAGTSATITGGSITTANATAGGALSLTANQGAIDTSDLTGGTGVQLRGSSSATIGNITASANNVDIVLASGLTGGNVTAANNIMIVNTSGAVTAGALSAGNTIAVTNGGAVTLASAAGSDITLASTANAINVSTVTARGALTGTAATALTLGTATAGSTIALTGQTINATTLTAATNITGTASGAMMIGSARVTGGNLTLNAAGALSVTTGGALGDVRLTSTNSGNITTGTLTSGSAFMGGTTGGMQGAGDIVITSDGNATMTGNSSAGRNLNVTARNLISVGGVANGTAIDLRSTDIAINTTSGRIGEQGRTTLAQLTNTGTGVTTIGGAGVTTGYSLSNAEAQRIFAGDIIITAARTIAPSTGTVAPLNDAAPDVVLDALTLTGATGQTGATAGNIGATGRLRIETPGKLRTIGAVAISNLASANRFQINAAQSIEVDAATGSVSLSGAGGALSGTIELTAPSVIAASLTAIGSVAAAADGRAISDRLAINDNAISDVGTFSADGIVVNVSNGFFVQNSGIKELSAFSFGDRRGITVGAGGLTINAASATTRIFVSGRQLQTNGSFITGIDFLRAQTINGTRIQLSTFPPTPFDPASTVNGCAIISASTCLVTIDGGSIARDVIGQSDDDSGGSSEGNGSGNSDFVRFEFKALDSSTFAAVIDDPVTGVGNDDLWALYDARDCTDDQNLESCGNGEAKPQEAKPQ